MSAAASRAGDAPLGAVVATIDPPAGRSRLPVVPTHATRSSQLGNRSTRRDHPRLHRLQAAQLPVDEVEAEYARPRRAAQVLPLVRAPHRPPGDALAWPSRP